jgi:hypothetical protein
MPWYRRLLMVLSAVAFRSVTIFLNRPPFSGSSNANGVPWSNIVNRIAYQESSNFKVSQKTERFLMCCPICHQSAIICGAPLHHDSSLPLWASCFEILQCDCHTPTTALPRLLIPSQTQTQTQTQRERATTTRTNPHSCLLFPSSHLLYHRRSFFHTTPQDLQGHWSYSIRVCGSPILHPSDIFDTSAATCFAITTPTINSFRSSNKHTHFHQESSTSN